LLDFFSKSHRLKSALPVPIANAVQGTVYVAPPCEGAEYRNPENSDRLARPKLAVDIARATLVARSLAALGVFMPA
jgi:hypothetical protein